MHLINTIAKISKHVHNVTTSSPPLNFIFYDQQDDIVFQYLSKLKFQTMPKRTSFFVREDENVDKQQTRSLRLYRSYP